MTATIILLILLIIISLASLYLLGLIPNTEPFFDKKFNNYFLSLLNSNTCEEVREIIENNQDTAFINYIAQNAEKIESIYPRDLLKNKINPMNCNYSDGNPIEF